MKVRKSHSLVLLLGLGIGLGANSNVTTEGVDSIGNVFICTGSSSKRYHYKKNCRGLSACKAAIRSVSKANAIEFGRTLCGWED